jgi:hypothetical protein
MRQSHGRAIQQRIDPRVNRRNIAPNKQKYEEQKNG